MEYFHRNCDEAHGFFFESWAEGKAGMENGKAKADVRIGGLPMFRIERLDSGFRFRVYGRDGFALVEGYNYEAESLEGGLDYLEKETKRRVAAYAASRPKSIPASPLMVAMLRSRM